MLSMLRGRTSTGGTLVDVGGGIGVATEEAERTAAPRTFARRIVVDPQRGMLTRGSRKRRDGPSVHWVRASGDQLPLPDGSVEVLLSLGVLCCMDGPDVPRAVSELYRVARPGGFCLLGVPKGWAPVTDPLFQSAGFLRVDQLRPGRVLYQRPAPTAMPAVQPMSQAI